MDADDIAVSNRFELQAAEFEKNLTWIYLVVKLLSLSAAQIILWLIATYRYYTLILGTLLDAVARSITQQLCIKSLLFRDLMGMM